MPPQLDIGETPSRRAGSQWREWSSSSLGHLVLGLATVVGTAIATWLVVDIWNDWAALWRGLMIPVGGVIGLATAIAVMRTAFYLLAPKAQRDAARERLRQILDARESYSLVPVDAWTRERENGLFVQCVVRNQGRGAKFSVVIENLEGLDKGETLDDPSAQLYWSDRPGTADEEIPPGETRLIGVATLARSAGGWVLRPMSIDGPRPAGRPYHFGDQARKVVAWIRVSVRGNPEINYSHRFGVVIDSPAGGVSPTVALTSEPENEEIELRMPAVEGLLDTICDSSTPGS